MQTGFIVLTSDARKELYQRGFVEDADAQNLENFEEARFTFNLLSDDGDQCVDAYGNPQLGTHRVFGSPIESFDPQMLLNPFEEQFYVPALLIKLSHQQSRQSKVIGQESQAAQVVSVIESDSAQFVGIVSGGVETAQRDDLIAAQPCGSVDGLRNQPAVIHTTFGADDEPSARSFDGVQPCVIDIASVHEIEGSRFVDQGVEPLNFLRFCRGNLDSCWQGSSQIQLRVELNGGTFPVELCPRTEAQSQIDDTGIQSINRFVQCHSQWVIGVELTSLPQEQLGQISIDAPVTLLIGIGQRTAANWCPEPQMVLVSRTSVEASFNVPEPLAPGQLCKGHANELAPAGELTDFVIAPISNNAAMKLLRVNPVEQLSQHVLSGVHCSENSKNTQSELKSITLSNYNGKSDFTA